MLASLILVAATLPLGAWPQSAGPAATVVDDVEFYLLEPEDDYYILAVQALETPLAKADPAAMQRLVRVAIRLGADAVLLLGELPEERIPEDVEEPLPTSGRFAVAVYLVFDDGSGEGGRPLPSGEDRGQGTGNRGQTPTLPGAPPGA
jgi:hypothetical protein